MAQTDDERPWTEKYRPATLDGIAGNVNVVQTLRKFLESRTLPHLLFHGPPGTGKTSTIIACARQMYGAHVRDMLLEINASDDNGIGTVRDTVYGFAQSKALFAGAGAGHVKLIVLDEAEYLTAEAQAALKRVMEQVSATARFCFVCNCPRALSAAIQSRCARFRFQPLGGSAIRHNIRQVAAAEHLVLAPGAEDAVVAVGLGDMRRVLNTMQACAFRQPEVRARDVYEVSGRPSPQQLDDVERVLTTLPVAGAYGELVRMLHAGGLSLADVVAELGVRAAKPSFSLYGAARDARQDSAGTLLVPQAAVPQAPAPGTPQAPAPVMCYLMSQLAKIEVGLAEASTDDVQAAALVSTFFLARHMLGNDVHAGPSAGGGEGAERCAV